MAYKHFPEDWPDMRDGLISWARSVAGVNVVWGRQGAPSPPRPYVTLQPLTLPVKEGSADIVRLPGTVVWVVEVLDDTTYSVTIEGTPCSYTSGTAATSDEIVSGLKAAIDAATLDVTTSLLLGGCRVEDAELVESQDENLALKLIRSFETEGPATFQVDVYGRDAQDAPEAPSIAGALDASLGSENVLQTLLEAGWAYVATEGPRNGDFAWPGRWEDRAGFDVRLRARVRSVELVDWIEHADLDTGIVGVLTP